MPTIHLTDNTSLDITASAPGAGATLNRYLKNPLSFNFQNAWKSITGAKVGDLDPKAFPITAGATGEGKFAVEESSVDVQQGASASLCLLKADKAKDFFDSLQWTADPAIAGLVSFGLKGTLSVGDTVKTGDFCFGITKAATVALTSFCTATATDTIEEAAKRAIAALTIPHDLADLKSLPPNTTCQIDAASSLKFIASVTYNVLNDPLATTSIAKLPSIAVNATAGATIEGTATHTSDHTITIAKLPDGLIHLSVCLTKTDDFETSLTVSASVTAGVGSQDALSFLLGKISPDSDAESKKIRSDLLADQAEQLCGDIKSAIDGVLASSLQASLKAALDDSHCNNRIFLYEIDLANLDAGSSAALQLALTGDFTALTVPQAKLAGIRELNSELTVTSSVKHSLTLHLLGIFNYGSTSAFVEKSKINYTKDTHEIVLSDETIEVVDNNLDSEKLRKVLLKGITLTLPASANTPAAATPMNLVFFDRQAATNRSTMRQFVNVLRATSDPSAAAATSLLDRNLDKYGTSSLYLGLNLNPERCRKLFVDPAGKSYNWITYLNSACGAQQTILADDDDNADRLKLFRAGQSFWQELRDAGAPDNKTRLLTAQGIRETALTDVVSLIWWSVAMEKYSKAMVTGSSLVNVGKDVVKDATGGFDEPWLVIAIWKMLEAPSIKAIFTSSLLKQALAA